MSNETEVKENNTQNVSKSKTMVETCKKLYKKSKEIYKVLMSEKYKTQTIITAIYLVFFILNIIYTPWSTKINGDLSSANLSNEKFHLFFFDSVFYGISDLIDLLAWNGSIEFVIIAVATLSIKDIGKNIIFTYLKGDLPEDLDEVKKQRKEKTKLGYYKKMQEQARAEAIAKANRSAQEIKNDVQNGIKEKFSEKVIDFMLDNILLYVCTFIIYLFFTYSDAINNGIIQEMEYFGTAGFIACIIGLFIIFVYAFPNLLKLFLYVGAITILGNTINSANSVNLFSNFTMSIISCAAILGINFIINLISDKFSEKLHTINGILDIKEAIVDFWGNRSYHFMFRIIVTVASPVVIFGIEYLLIVSTLAMLGV